MATATLLPRSRVRQAGCSGRALTQFAVGSLQRLPGLVQAQAVAVPGITRDIRVKLASTAAEWEQAFQMAADNYQARGFETGGADYRFTAYHALPDTVVLVAKEAHRVLATFSLVPDNTLLGLPLESLYRAELQELRRQGRRLFETGTLADRDLSMREFVQVFASLMQLGWQYQLRQGADTTVIAVNPRHSSFYTKAQGFLPLGSRRAYGNVEGHPAEAFYLCPELMRSGAPRMHQRIFGQRLPEAVLQVPRMPAPLVRHFAQHSSQTAPRAVEQILWHAAQGASLRRW